MPTKKVWGAKGPMVAEGLDSLNPIRDCAFTSSAPVKNPGEAAPAGSLMLVDANRKGKCITNFPVGTTVATTVAALKAYAEEKGFTVAGTTDAEKLASIMAALEPRTVIVLTGTEYAETDLVNNVNALRATAEEILHITMRCCRIDELPIAADVASADSAVIGAALRLAVYADGTVHAVPKGLEPAGSISVPLKAIVVKSGTKVYSDGVTRPIVSIFMS